MTLSSADAATIGRPVSVELPPDFFNRPLAEVDPEIAEVLALDLERQQQTLEMIASENFAPAAVLECQGSVLSNKYAEGYPGRRYYGGCEHVDVAEQLAIDRAKALFGADHANVQPHAGAQANTAVYHALLQPGDTLMGLELAHGGHLSHGMKINVSGRLYEIVAYHVDRETSLIDMDEVERLAYERRPKMIVAGRAAPRPGSARRRGDHHDPQDDRWRPRRHDPLQGGAGQEDRLGRVPRPAGRPARAHHRGQGRGAADRR